MKTLLLAMTTIGLAQLQAQTVELSLAPTQADDLFANRKYDLALVACASPGPARELPAKLFQIAGKLVAPVAQPEQKPLNLKASESFKQAAVYPVELPKVEHKTQFILRFDEGGALRLTAYPENLLQPLRELDEKRLKIFTLSSAADLSGFFEREKIRSTELGPNVPPEFTERGIILARKETDEPPAWPSQLYPGQALVIFHRPEANDLPRITASPLGRGVLVQVRMGGFEALATSPRSQELLLELFDFIRTQLEPLPHSPIP